MNALALPPDFADRVLRNEPMERHTSWHVGGPADLLFAPSDASDLAAFLQKLDANVPIMWIGLGSNLLVRDGGIRGAVIETHGVFAELERLRPRLKQRMAQCLEGRQLRTREVAVSLKQFERSWQVEER